MNTRMLIFVTVNNVHWLYANERQNVHCDDHDTIITLVPPVSHLPCTAMPTFNKHNRRVSCPHCTNVFARGRGFQKHVRVCTGPEGASSAASSPAAVSEDAMEMPIDSPDDDDDVARETVHDDRISIEAHFDRLEDLGTLDLEHVMQYSTWGKVHVKKKEVEICRFLRSTEVGGGSSDGKSEAALLYAKSLGGRGKLLPKTLRTCWATVDRVSLACALQCSLSYSLSYSL